MVERKGLVSARGDHIQVAVTIIVCPTAAPSRTKLVDSCRCCNFFERNVDAWIRLRREIQLKTVVHIRRVAPRPPCSQVKRPPRLRIISEAGGNSNILYTLGKSAESVESYPLQISCIQPLWLVRV